MGSDDDDQVNQLLYDQSIFCIHQKDTHVDHGGRQDLKVMYVSDD